MTATTTLWQDRDFRGSSQTRNSGGHRYLGTRWHAHNDQFSSMKTWSHGTRANAYAFEHINYDGRFSSLNVDPGEISWWSYFGSAFNDRVSSSLIVERAPAARESPVEVGRLVATQFRTLFDEQAAGTGLSRVGNPRTYVTFFPSYDSSRVFGTIDQMLNVDVPNWWDYSAQVRYDIRFRVLADGSVDAYAAWSHVWVEGGLISGQVFDRIAPRLHGAKTAITEAVRGFLKLLGRGRYADVYLLPGFVPDMNSFGRFGTYDEEVTLVLVRA